LALLLPTSCSLMFVNGPPNGARYAEEGQCTTSDGWPAFDVVLSGLEGVRTGIAIAASDADYKGTSLSRPADIAIGASLVALTAISAGVGFSRVNECKEAIEAGSGGSYHPRYHRRVVAPPAARSPAAAPADSSQEPTVTPAVGAPGQQQDEDDPGARPRPAPTQQKPDAPRFGG
jgi:hypothetical protein